MPYITARGAIDGLVITYTNVTEVMKKEAELRDSEQRFRLALASAPIVVFLSDFEHRYTWLYGAKQSFLPEDAIGKADDAILPPEDARQLLDFKRAVVAGEERVQRETELSSRRHFEISGEPLPDASGKVVGVAAAAVEITERIRNERRQAMLMRALQHRVKNILANVSAIALQTRQSAATVDEFVKALEDRVQALAVTQDLLIRTPGEPVDLEALVTEELKPYAAQELASVSKDRRSGSTRRSRRASAR